MIQNILDCLQFEHKNGTELIQIAQGKYKLSENTKELVNALKTTLKDKQ